jgi:hypothetical protein
MVKSESDDNEKKRYGSGEITGKLEESFHRGPAAKCA